MGHLGAPLDGCDGVFDGEATEPGVLEDVSANDDPGYRYVQFEGHARLVVVVNVQVNLLAGKPLDLLFDPLDELSVVQDTPVAVR